MEVPLTVQEQLDDAREQYHLLLTGQQARVFVDQNGERIEYTQANRGALAAYIAKLERQIGGGRQGPMKVSIYG